MFLAQLLIGSFLICLTVVIHAIALDRIFAGLEKISPMLHKLFRGVWKVPVLVLTVLGVFTAHVVQIWIWAVFYLQAGTLATMEEALYFSTSTFTTVGFGDLVLDTDWRLISSFQSANGFILFGWSTAFIFEVTSKVYKKDMIKGAP